MKCEDCRGSNIILDDILGEYYCSDCGLILEDNVADYSDLSFTFTGDKQSVHHSISSFMEAGSGRLGTPLGKIMRKLRSLKGAYVDSPTESLERGFKEALPSLRAIWGMASLPMDLRLGSALLYRKCIRKKLTAGRRIEEMALAATHNVCSTSGFGMDIPRIVKELGVSMENVHTYSELIQGKMKPVSGGLYVTDYIRKGIEELGLSDPAAEKAISMGDAVLGKRLELGKHPAVVAGAVIYKACEEGKEGVSQAKVAKILNVSERSVRRVAKAI